MLSMPHRAMHTRLAPNDDNHLSSKNYNSFKARNLCVLACTGFLCFLSCRFTQETQEGRRDRVPDKEGRELMTSPSKNHPNQSSQRRQRQNTRQGTKKTHEQFQSEQSERTKRQRTAHCQVGTQVWTECKHYWSSCHTASCNQYKSCIWVCTTRLYRTCSVLRSNLKPKF